MRRGKTEARYLALQKTCAVDLHVCLETLLRGSTLGFLSMAGRTLSDMARGKRGLRKRRKGRGSAPSRSREMVVVWTEGFANGLVCLAFAFRSTM